MTQAKAAPSHQPEKIHALTSLRFFAALIVVFFHTLLITVPSIATVRIIPRTVSIGYVSVSFFFLLSGYILGMVYLRSERPINKGKFYAARFARIYPLYLLTLLADTPDLLLSLREKLGWAGAVSKTAKPLIVHIVMLQSWILGLRRIDGPNWSLSVEVIFYLLFPFIGILIWRLKGWQLWASAILVGVGGQLLVCWTTLHVADYAIRDNPILHVSTFALGIFLARWQCLQRDRWGSSPRRGSSIAIALILAVIGFAALVHWQQLIPEASIRDGILAPVFLLIIWAFSANQSLPARLVSPKWLVILGEASYGLYLIHMPVYHVWERLHLRAIPALYPVYLAICIGLSVLSFYFVETPARKWILRKLQTRSKETMEAASDAQ
jgi:peptidoglycan/LPS O-acetylase OafA/YrhL